MLLCNLVPDIFDPVFPVLSFILEIFIVKTKLRIIVDQENNFEKKLYLIYKEIKHLKNQFLSILIGKIL